jgi:hypothetical protein
MYIDKSTEFKIRNKVTGEIKTAYKGHKPWIIVDEKGNEIMADWEVYEDKSIVKSAFAIGSIVFMTGFIYWMCFSESFYFSVVGFCEACG